jgi:cell division protein ZapA
MPENVKTVRIEVFGNEYNIRGQADPEYIARVAAYVDQKMREVNERLALPSISQVAILASLNIADELFRERDERQRAAQAVRDRADHLEEMLVATLSGSSAEPPQGAGRMALEPQA